MQKVEMTDELIEKINSAVKGCKDRARFSVCRRVCFPCYETIDSGKCGLIYEVIKSHLKEKEAES